jgi:hypothetical protein
MGLLAEDGFLVKTIKAREALFAHVTSGNRVSDI